MGRIHRYGQKHDPVVIINLVAGKTREGRVLKTLLEKLERIRREMRSDKVFDVVGRLFEEVIPDYLEQTLTDEEAEAAAEAGGQADARAGGGPRRPGAVIYGDGGDVASRAERATTWSVSAGAGCSRATCAASSNAAPLLGLGSRATWTASSPSRPRRGRSTPSGPPGGLPGRPTERLSVEKPAGGEKAIFLHPGEPLFDALRVRLARLDEDARGGASSSIPRRAGRTSSTWRASPSAGRPSRAAGAGTSRTLEYRLVGLRQEEGGPIETCPVERLLLLKGAEPAVGGRPAWRRRRPACGGPRLCSEQSPAPWPSHIARRCWPPCPSGWSSLPAATPTRTPTWPPRAAA